MGEGDMNTKYNFYNEYVRYYFENWDRDNTISRVVPVGVRIGKIEEEIK